MEIDMWTDPIFGYVPNEFRSWYADESGTRWNSQTKKWTIEPDVVGTWFAEKDLKHYRPINIYKANDFQDKMQMAKEILMGELANLGRYAIGNKEVFSLMKDGRSDVQYTFEGETYVKGVVAKV